MIRCNAIGSTNDTFCVLVGFIRLEHLKMRSLFYLTYSSAIAFAIFSMNYSSEPNRNHLSKMILLRALHIKGKFNIQLPSLVTIFYIPRLIPLDRGLALTKVVTFKLGKSKVTRALLTIGQQALSAEVLRAFLVVS